jgi:uncharacterized protein with PIN domain
MPNCFTTSAGCRNDPGYLRDRRGPVSRSRSCARQAFLDFGKGRHKPSLNFGDCFAYALAKATGEPLLFKGNDFALTDIMPAA